MKEFRGSIAISYPYDEVDNPLKIAAAVEDTFKKGVDELKKIAPGATINMTTGIVTARAKRGTERSGAPAGGHPGGPGKGTPPKPDDGPARDIGEDKPGDVPAFMRAAS